MVIFDAAFWRSKWQIRVLDYQKLFPAARNFLSAPALCTYLIPVLLESFLIIFNANQAEGRDRPPNTTRPFWATPAGTAAAPGPAGRREGPEKRRS